jgi:hypothetical protein
MATWTLGITFFHQICGLNAMALEKNILYPVHVCVCDTVKSWHDSVEAKPQWYHRKTATVILGDSSSVWHFAQADSKSSVTTTWLAIAPAGQSFLKV